MTTPRSDDHTNGAGLFDNGPQRLTGPYPGGRAQAESGSKIIENDYEAWKAVRAQPYRLPAAHPLIQQFTQAWHPVSTLGLGDDAGAASIRYRVLAHAARSLATGVSQADYRRETDTLLNLSRHASIHGHRLYATGLDQFLNSGASGRYNGFAQAAAGSALVEKYYLAWEQAPSARLAATDIGLADDAAFLRQAWADIEQHGLTDGSGTESERHRALADRARAVSDDVAQRLPSAALTLLLELAMHADKHQIQLHNTAIAMEGAAVEQLQRSAYRGLPTEVAATAAHAHAETPQISQAPASAGIGSADQITRKRITQTAREP